VKPRRPAHELLKSTTSPVPWRCVAAGLLLAFSLVTPPRAAAAQPTGGGPSPAVRVLVSLGARWLWVVRGGDTLFSAPVAVGRGGTVTLAGRTYQWTTPRGTRRVLRKTKDPFWNVPDWHYYERAAEERLTLVKLKRGSKYPVPGSAFLEVHDDDVGWVGSSGAFHAIEPGREIVIADTLYMPPAGTRQRHVPHALGEYALYLGGGYLIHGTNEFNDESIGEAASHGCIRMDNADVEKVYGLVPVGAEVTIY
jgi:L,D-transpeptidase catalytic domain